jgi:DNA polymerase III epsilon subunit-like protein
MPELKYVIYIIDTETTGLDAVKNDVIEISACRLTMGDEVTRDQKTWYLKAMSPETIEDEALAINHHNKSDILWLTKAGKDKYRLPSDVVVEIENWIAEDGLSSLDRIFAGQNPQFDVNALTELWRKTGSPETFPFLLTNNSRIIDTKMLAAMIDVCTGKRRRYYNLGTLVKSFGVKKAKAHTAEGDVQMTADLLLKMITPLIPIISETFKDCYTDLDM